MLSRIQQEIDQPRTPLGKRYMILLMVVIVGSILFLFIEKEYPLLFPLGSLQLLLVEATIVLFFGTDLALRSCVIRWRDRVSVLFLIVDALAIIPSLLTLLYYAGIIESAQFGVLALLRLFRILRVVMLLRVSKTLTLVFGGSVFTLVCGTMAAHLSLRVFIQEMSFFFGVDVFALFNHEVLMIAVSAVGSVLGIALAITFGVVKRKQIAISQLHRAALDSLEAFRRDMRILNLDAQQVDFDRWYRSLDQFMEMEISYTEMKQHTNQLLVQIRIAIKDRPSLDVPYHNGLVQSMSAFLTKTQIEFHPAFYTWMDVIANLYFALMMVVTQGVTGIIVQMLVIYVFKGLVVVIDDMDHAVDNEVTIFNSKILPI